MKRIRLNMDTGEDVDQIQGDNSMSPQHVEESLDVSSQRSPETQAQTFDSLIEEAMSQRADYESQTANVCINSLNLNLVKLFFIY